MPFRTLAELPPQVRKRPKAAQEAFRSAFNAALQRNGGDEGGAFRIAYAAARLAERKAGRTSKAAAEDDARVVKAAERRRLATRGAAMPGKSHPFPIATVADLRNAIRSFGRAKDKAAAKRHIIRRARVLGATNLLPASWRTTDTAEARFTHSEISEILSRALRAKFSDDLGRSRYAWIRETADDYLVYSLDERLFKAGYTIASSGAATINDGVEVVEKHSWVPVKRT
jgi:cation transport regulator ChaB